jgi:acyl carrier protein
MSANSKENELTTSITALIAHALVVSEDQINRDLAYGDLPEWDSLGHMNIMMALEEKYGIQITTEMITNLVNIKAITTFLVENHHA